MKPELCWRPQDIGDIKVMDYLPRRAVDQVWNQPKKCVTVNKGGRSWSSKECLDVRHGEAEFDVCPARCQSCFVVGFSSLCFLTYLWESNAYSGLLNVGSM